MARYDAQVVVSGDVFDAECYDTALDEPCFRSAGWGTQEQAANRIREHLYEHAEGVPMREVGAFRDGVSQGEYEVRVEELLARNSVDVPTDIPTSGEVTQ